MDIKAIKIDNNTIQVTKTEIVTNETVNTYDLKFLLQQRQNILDQKQRDNNQRDKELAEIDSLINNFSNLGIVIGEI